MNQIEIHLTRRYRIGLVHQIDEKFVGPDCSRKHGHEIVFDVTIDNSQLNQSQQQIDSIVDSAILKPYRERPLSEIQKHSTGEAIAAEFFKILGLPNHFGQNLKTIHIAETRKNHFQAICN